MRAFIRRFGCRFGLMATAVSLVGIGNIALAGSAPTGLEGGIGYGAWLTTGTFDQGEVYFSKVTGATQMVTVNDVAFQVRRGGAMDQGPTCAEFATDTANPANTDIATIINSATPTCSTAPVAIITDAVTDTAKNAANTDARNGVGYNRSAFTGAASIVGQVANYIESGIQGAFTGAAQNTAQLAGLNELSATGVIDEKGALRTGLLPI